MSVSATARTTDDASMVPSLKRALTLGAQVSHRTVEGTLISSFSTSTASRKVSVPCDPLPKYVYRATGIACVFTHRQVHLTAGSAARATRMAVSRCSSRSSALLAGLVEPRDFPLRV